MTIHSLMNMMFCHPDVTVIVWNMYGSRLIYGSSLPGHSRKYEDMPSGVYELDVSSFEVMAIDCANRVTGVKIYADTI